MPKIQPVVTFRKAPFGRKERTTYSEMVQKILGKSDISKKKKKTRVAKDDRTKGRGFSEESIKDENGSSKGLGAL